VILFFWLIFGHCLADYPLQGDFLARGKNQTAPLPGVPWQVALFAHSMIHAGFVAALSGSPFLGLAELVAHMVIDYAKCEGWLGRPTHDSARRAAFWIDQGLHVGCKMLWVVLL
jgi:hypothetical protein